MTVKATDRQAGDDTPGGQPVRRGVGRPATARARGAVVPTLPAQGSRSPSAYKGSPDCELINSLARGLQVLAAFGPDDDLLGNKDIAARTGIPKPSVSRLTDTLVKLNFLQQDAANGLYRLGSATIALGLTARHSLDLATIAQPFMERFALEHGISVELGTLDGLEIRARAIRTDTASADRTDLFLGADFALDDTALGLAFICGLSVEARGDLLARLKTARGDAWPASEARVAAALTHYANAGYCLSLGEWRGRTNALGAPLTADGADTPLSLCIMGAADDVPAARLEELAPYFMGLIATIRAAARQKQRQG